MFFFIYGQMSCAYFNISLSSLHSLNMKSNSFWYYLNLPLCRHQQTSKAMISCIVNRRNTSHSASIDMQSKHRVKCQDLLEINSIENTFMEQRLVDYVFAGEAKNSTISYGCDFQVKQQVNQNWTKFFCFF